MEWYHIALLDRPTIVWDFHSLLLGVQMMFSFLLTDDKTTLRCCELYRKWNGRPVTGWAMVRNQLSIDDKLQRRILKHENE